MSFKYNILKISSNQTEKYDSEEEEDIYKYPIPRHVGFSCSDMFMFFMSYAGLAGIAYMVYNCQK